MVMLPHKVIKKTLRLDPEKLAQLQKLFNRIRIGNINGLLAPAPLERTPRRPQRPLPVATPHPRLFPRSQRDVAAPPERPAAKRSAAPRGLDMQCRSGDFEVYWRFHLEQEHQRNHTTHYADGKVPRQRQPERQGTGAHLRLIK